jgi:hypothetical protein
MIKQILSHAGNSFFFVENSGGIRSTRCDELSVLDQDGHPATVSFPGGTIDEVMGHMTESKSTSNNGESAVSTCTGISHLHEVRFDHQTMLTKVLENE